MKLVPSHMRLITPDRAIYRAHAINLEARANSRLTCPKGRQDCPTPSTHLTYCLEYYPLQSQRHQGQSTCKMCMVMQHPESDFRRQACTHLVPSLDSVCYDDLVSVVAVRFEARGQDPSALGLGKFCRDLQQLNICDRVDPSRQL